MDDRQRAAEHERREQQHGSGGRLAPEAPGEGPEADRGGAGLGEREPAQPTEGVEEGPEHELRTGGDVVPARGCGGRIRDRVGKVAVDELAAERDEPERVGADQPECAGEAGKGGHGPHDRPGGWGFVRELRRGRSGADVLPSRLDVIGGCHPSLASRTSTDPWSRYREQRRGS